MKQMNIRAEAALLEVARRHHTTVEEVRREIRLAMAMAMCNPAPAARKSGVRSPVMETSSRRRISSPMPRCDAGKGNAESFLPVLRVKAVLFHLHLHFLCFLHW